MSRQKSRIWSEILFITGCAAACYILLFCPISRQIGLTFRNTLYVMPLVFIAALFYGTIRKIYLKCVFRVLLFAFILLPYSGLINSGASDQYALGGVVPWSDAFTMQLNTQRFLYGGTMSQATAIRPISTVFYAVFLRLFGNNYFALQIFLAVSIALCMISALDSVRGCYGNICGALFYTVLFFYIRQRLGTFMTEQYGFICGLLCCFFLLTGMRKQKQILMLLSFLFLSIGLNARPAAMFLFPAIGLWYFFVYLENTPHRFLWAGAALIIMLSGFIMNRAAQKAVYGDDPIPNRQAAEMVYGLCLGGKAWGDVVSTPEMTALNQSENIIKDVASLCMPVLKEHPENILLALKTIFFDSLIKSEYYGAFSYVRGNPQRFQKAVRFGFMALWLLGVFTLIRKREKPQNSLLLVSVLGIILSECAAVPFSTNYLRLYAVSMWVPACVTGIFPQMLLSEKSRKEYLAGRMTLPDYDYFPYIIGGMIFLIAVFGTNFISSAPLAIPSVLPGKCAADEDILLTSIDPGSFIYLDEKENLQSEHIPYFRLPYVRQHIHDTASIEMFGFTDAIDDPTAIIRGIDLTNYEDALIFVPLNIVEGKTGYAQFCGHFIDPPILRNDRFFIPSTVFFLKDTL